MTELLENLVSVSLTDAELAIIDQGFDILEAKFSFLISLSDDEIKTLFKLHAGNRPFCEAVLAEMLLWKKPMNASLKTTELEKDLSFTNVIPPFMTRAEKIARLLQCTYLRSGAEAINMALKFRDFLAYESSMGDSDAKAAAARLDLHFEVQKIKAANTRNNKLLQKPDAANTPPDKTE
jgi:hypothetical protein